MRPFHRSVFLWLALGCGLLLLDIARDARAVELMDDPKGFLGIPWGASLATVDSLTAVNQTDRLMEYEPKEKPPRLDTIAVRDITFVSLEGQFARVSIRYRGADVHKQVMAYLERRFGALDKTPGQMVRGLNQQYNWRGVETEINVTYEGQSERGFVFFDSRTLAPRFSDGLTDSLE